MIALLRARRMLSNDRLQKIPNYYDKMRSYSYINIFSIMYKMPWDLFGLRSIVSVYMMQMVQIY